MNRLSRCKQFAACAGCCITISFATPAFAQSTFTPPPSNSQIAKPALPAPGTPSLTPPQPSISIFSDLFGDLVGDFRNLPSKESAAWLGVGAAAALVGHAGDTPVTQVMSVRSLEEPFESGRVIGGAAMQMGGALATYSIGRISGSTRTAAVGAELFRAQILSQSMTSLIKLSASRTRPDGSNNLSFPSGHTASAFATATVLERNFGWKVGIPAYAAAAFVGASRIQSQKHYLSDVAFGAAIGILAGRTVTIGPKEARFAVAPFAVDGGGGVGFTLLNK